MLLDCQLVAGALGKISKSRQTDHDDVRVLFSSCRMWIPMNFRGLVMRCIREEDLVSRGAEDKARAWKEWKELARRVTEGERRACVNERNFQQRSCAGPEA
jgi:hypothetical protein